MQAFSLLCVFVLSVYYSPCYSIIDADRTTTVSRKSEIQTVKFEKEIQNYKSIASRKKVADENLINNKQNEQIPNSERRVYTLLGDGEVITYNPGDRAPAFSVYTLGGKYIFPKEFSRNRSLIMHLFDPNSAFLECLWMSDDALEPLLVKANFSDTEFLFVSKSARYNQLFGAQWMKERLESIYRKKYVRTTQELKSLCTILICN